MQKQKPARSQDKTHYTTDQGSSGQGTEPYKSAKSVCQDMCNTNHVYMVNGSFMVGFLFLWQTDRDVLMRLVLQVKGVISVTFDMNKKRCFLRVKPDIKPEVF